MKRKSPTEVASTSPANIPASSVESPSSKAIGDPAQQHNRQSQGQARGPVVHAEDGVRAGHHPVNQGGFFQIRYAVQPRGDPVAGDKHVAGDLCLNGVHVIHQTRRANDIYKEDESRLQLQRSNLVE